MKVNHNHTTSKGFTIVALVILTFAAACKRTSV